MDNKIIKAGVGGLVLSMFITGCSNDKQNLGPRIASDIAKNAIEQKISSKGDIKQIVKKELVKKAISVAIDVATKKREEATHSTVTNQVRNNQVVLNGHHSTSHKVTRTEKKRLNNATKKLRQQKKIEANVKSEKIIAKRFKITKTYIVKSGDTVSGISEKLRVSQKDLNLPRDNKDLIYPGEKISYVKSIKRFIKVKTNNNRGFCFKDSHSIHYRASERCK